MDTTTRLSARPAAAWFCRLWGVAVLAHVVGNPRVGRLWPDPGALGVATFLLGVAALALVALPHRRSVLALVSVLVPVVVWFEAPFVGNHWLLAGFVSAAILVALAREDWWDAFAPTGRWMLLGFYSFAAFAKLNEGFFDPSVSCGVVYADQWLAAAGLPILPASGVLPHLAIWGTALVELSVPVLLLIPRTRRLGVLLAMTFHFVISLDLGQHFYDFTAVLLALFTLFLPDEQLDGLEKRTAVRDSIAVAGAAAAVILLLASVGPPSPATVWLLTRGAFVVWIPYGARVTWRTARAAPGDGVALRVRSPAMAVLVALVVANGFAPYLEVKTATAWNMYANLETAGGESNHLVLRRTLPLTGIQDSPVEILSSSDRGLDAYAGSGWLLPERNLRSRLSRHPDAVVTYRQEGETITVTGSRVAEKPSVLAEKFQFFRAIDASAPPRCQLTWMPAG